MCVRSAMAPEQMVTQVAQIAQWNISSWDLVSGGAACLRLLVQYRPCLFDACFVVSRITILCYSIRLF